MRSSLVGALGVAAGLGLSGCAGMPDYQLGIQDSNKDPATPLFAHLICEIAASGHFAELQRDHVQVTVALTLTVDDSGGIAPSLSFIHPAHITPRSETDIVGGEVTKARKRTLTRNVHFDVADVDPKASCAADTNAKVLGSFHVGTLIDSQMAAPALPGVTVADKDALFGTTVQFALKLSLNGGPTWVRVHFKGPGDKGIFNTSRTDTSSLVIAFAKPAAGARSAASSTPNPAFLESLLNPDQRKIFESLSPRRLTPEEQAAADAEAARALARERANNLVTQMILQNLTLSPQ